jgi:release factor glutamine methyltransferase
MKNSKHVLKEIVAAISLPESSDEIESLAFVIIENLFGLSRTDVLREAPVNMSSARVAELQAIIKRINASEPVQYVLEEAYFYGRLFKVTPTVLIPRQETELLIDVVKEYFLQTEKHLRILDIGTGSGCIGISLALEILPTHVAGVDISKDALNIARHNAELHDVPVNFSTLDILKQEIENTFEVVVSNPPYIAETEKATMQDNVVRFEPHIALFVPDHDPLVFYRNIAMKSFNALSSGGLLATEINERFGKEVADLYITAGFSDVDIVKDINGKDRVVKGYKPRE